MRISDWSSDGALPICPGALPRLLALSQHRPLLSPQSVADQLAMSIAGASKLLDRAAAAGLLIEITQRRSWRLFLTPDMAIAFRSEERRLGKEGVSTGRSRWSPDH